MLLACYVIVAVVRHCNVTRENHDVPVWRSSCWFVYSLVGQMGRSNELLLVPEV